MPYVKYAKMVRGQKWVEDLRNQSSSIDFELHLSSIAAEMCCPPVFKSWEGVHPDLFRPKSYSSTATNHQLHSPFHLVYSTSS